MRKLNHRIILPVTLVIFMLVLVLAMLLKPLNRPTTTIAPTDDLSAPLVPTAPNSNPSLTDQISEFTAGFYIYTDGSLRDFSPAMYRTQNPDAYIDLQGSPYLIQVKKIGTTWQTFFDSLPKPFAISETCLTTGTGDEYCNQTDPDNLTFYQNGQPIKNPLSQPIRPGDFLLISAGEIDPTDLTRIINDSPLME